MTPTFSHSVSHSHPIPHTPSHQRNSMCTIAVTGATACEQSPWAHTSREDSKSLAHSFCRTLPAAKSCDACGRPAVLCVSNREIHRLPRFSSRFLIGVCAQGFHVKFPCTEGCAPGGTGGQRVNKEEMAQNIAQQVSRGAEYMELQIKQRTVESGTCGDAVV